MLSALPFLLAATLPFANGERIAFLGDSITQLGTDDPRGWVNHVERAIRAETPEVSFIQAGISGHTSRDMLARVERDVLSRKPDWMFFSCGVNDAPNGYTDERKNKDVPLTEYRVNVSAIFDKCEKRGVKVIVLSQTPVVEEPAHVANANLVAYNAALKALAFERGYRYLDPGAAIRAAIERKADKSKRTLTIDGTHLNDAGNRIYADTVLAGLRNERRLSLTVARHIKGNWQKTVRFNRTDEGTKIGLPFKYTVPCMADKFQEMYYWDTYFTNVGLILSGLTEQARDNVGNIAYLIEKFGYMPNGNRTYYLSRSQPPFFTRMVSEVYDAKPDKAWLAKMYAAAVKEHAFWQAQRLTASGLNRYSGSFRDDAQRKAIVEEFIPRAGWKMPTDPQEVRRMSEIFISYAESGWDCTSRFDWNPQENDWVDLNSLLYGMERDLERFAGILGNGEEAKWRTAAEKRRALMNRVMWDEQLGMFCDHDFVKDARSPFVSAAAFYPLFVGLATPEQAKRTVAFLPRIECAFGVAASQKDGIKDLQWDYPHGWACLQYVVVQGLLRYGYKNDARRIAVKYARMVERVFVDTGSLWEKYDVTTGKVSVSREYETPKMLGWSAGVYLAFARLLEGTDANE